MKKIKKYYKIKNYKIFTGNLIVSELAKVSRTAEEISQSGDVFYDLFINSNLVYNILKSFDEIDLRIINLMNKYSDKKFEQEEQWSDIIIQDLTSLFNSIEMIAKRYSPEKHNLANNNNYLNLHAYFDDLLYDISEMLDKYFYIEDFQQVDRSKFDPTQQIQISVLGDYGDDIDVIPQRSGFYDAAHKRILKKEIVSIRKANKVNDGTLNQN